jgi:hypothetical protein
LEADEFVQKHFPVDGVLPGIQFVGDLKPYHMRKLPAYRAGGHWQTART